MRKWSRSLLALAAAATLAGCAGYGAFRAAQIAEQRGDWDQAVLHYLELADQYPSNLAYKAGLLRARIRASQAHFDRAKQLHQLGALEQAVREYRQAVQLDPANQFAQVELRKASEELAAARGAVAGPSTLEEMKERVRRERPQPPQLNPRSDEPISLSFPNRVNVFDIYEALGKAFGINIQFDPKLRPTQMAIELEEVTAREALEVVMQAAGHFYKVLNEDTIIVVEDNQQNRRKYEDLVIQTFYLSNAEVKDMMTLLRSLVGAKNIASNDQLNAIVLKDTADTVKVAESIIQANDKARGEVVIDVELLQIDTNKMRELGVSLSSYQVGQSLDQDPPLRVSDLEFLDQSDWILTLPSFLYDFVKTSTEAQLLANPQVRISDGEEASLTIGDRVPIPVTTFNTGQTVGGNIVPITSFQYQDVGIRLQIEPRMHHNREVTLNLEVEVANLAGFVEGTGGQQQPIIGTRNIQSTIRLQDGETNFLAGLIRDDNTLSDTGMPGLSDIPVLGRLFSRKSTEKRRTDLVLTLTPHIIRSADITAEDLLPIWVGTEQDLSFSGVSPRVESEIPGPFDEEEDLEEQERIREMIRQRIQSLPQGVQEGVEGVEEAPPGVELAPAAPPEELFGDEEEDEDDEEYEEEPPSPETSARLEAGPDGAWRLAAFQSGQRLRPVLAAAERQTPQAAEEEEPPPVRLALRAARPAVVVGEQIQVVLTAASERPVSHFPVRLRYDPRLFEVVDVEAGGFLGGPGAIAFLSDTSAPGEIVLGASRVGQVPGVTGQGVVARLTLRALAPGAGTIGFGRPSRALDARRRRLPVVRRVVELEVVATAEELPPAPEPPGQEEAPPPPPPRAVAAVPRGIVVAA